MKPAFVALSAKLTLNVHDLNNEMSTGNVVDIRTVAMIDESGRKVEAPAVSGRMIKHWHQALMTELAIRRGLPLCDGCRAGEPIRPGEWTEKKQGEKELRQVPMTEDKAVRQCVICDAHGYLIAQGGKKEVGLSARRNSRAMFSWALPVLGTESVTTQVTHTRVSQIGQIGEGEGAQAGQALFYKSYASQQVGLVVALDLERIGYVNTTGEMVLNPSEWQSRAEIAVEACRSLISGRLGASMSHSLPHVNCTELVLAISSEGPVPVPPSPIYNGYVNRFVDVMPKEARIFAYGVADAPETVTLADTISAAFNMAHQLFAEGA